MKVLSLFDGMACGMIAMQLAGVEVESYDAYEIDKYAIKTAQHNFPMIKEHGDVFSADFTQYEGVDFLIGGSPCTYWSIAQTKNRETVASGMGWELFSQYVRALHEAKPKYFIYENNKSMSKSIRASIDETFGFEAVLINSALVSAQNRQRLYWVGKRNEDGTYSKVLVEQPEDRGILLRDILETGVCWRDKSYTLDANYYNGGNLTSLEKQSGKRLMAAESLITTPDGKSFCITATYYKDGIRNVVGNTVDRKTCVAETVRIGTYPTSDGRLLNSQGSRIYSVDGKAVTQSAQGGGRGSKTGFTDGKTQTLSTSHIPNVIEHKSDKKYPVYEVRNGLITIKGKQYPIKLQDDYYIIRKLTVRECMRLQTVPEWYEFPVSDSQAYKMLGNGWTCEVIAHILKYLKGA